MQCAYNKKKHKHDLRVTYSMTTILKMACLIMCKVTFLLLYILLNAQSGQIYAICEPIHTCECQPHGNTEYAEYYCNANDIRNITLSLPTNTILFHYTAVEMELDLQTLNFSQLQNLRFLYIVSDIKNHDFRKLLFLR